MLILDEPERGGSVAAVCLHGVVSVAFAGFQSNGDDFYPTRKLLWSLLLELLKPDVWSHAAEGAKVILTDARDGHGFVSDLIHRIRHDRRLSPPNDTVECHTRSYDPQACAQR